MLTLHVLTFIDIFQHRVFCFKCVIYVLFNSTMTVVPVKSSSCLGSCYMPVLLLYMIV